MSSSTSPRSASYIDGVASGPPSPSVPPPPPIDPTVHDASAANDVYVDLASPTTQSMRIRLRKQKSLNAALAQHDAESGDSGESLTAKRLVARVKKKSFAPEARLFRRYLRLSARIAVGVLVAGLAQTGGGSERQWLLLPSSYYLGGLNYAATMVIFASATTIGGVIQNIWQIDLGVAIALLFNFVVSAAIPLTQGDLMHMSSTLRGIAYVVSLRDWGIATPLILAFTFLIFVSPVQENVKKFAVSTNLFFILTIVSPMNPIYPTQRKDLTDDYFGTHNLINNLAMYSVVGVVGTLISLGIMLVPFPVFAIRKLRRHTEYAPHDIREILNLIMDAYCFRAKDIKEMDFFRLRLERQLEAAEERLATMQQLLDDCWWEELVGIGYFLRFNKTVAKQFVKLYAKLLKDLVAMKFAIQCETGHWTHVVLMKKMQKSLYVLQTETNDLLEEISYKVRHASRSMASPRFAHLEGALERLMIKYTHLYGEVLSSDVHTSDDVGKTMAMNLFVYSFHAFAHNLAAFQDQFNHKNFSARYRVKNFLKLVWNGIVQRGNYPRKLVFFSFRTTLAVLIGVCCATFLFGFSSTAPTAIAMVATYHIGGTYSNTVNRLTGLVAGTVVPSILNFFVCKVSDNVLYNLLNNVVLFIWTVGSMYVYFSAQYMSLAGMVSAYMAVSVLLGHSCSSSSTSSSLAYTTLTENSLGILTLMLVELTIKPHSARGLLRANIQRTMTLYSDAFRRVFLHHLACSQPTEVNASGESAGTGDKTDASVGSFSSTQPAELDANDVKELRKQLDAIIPQLLDEQATLVHDASMEPNLWKPKFSDAKYRGVLDASRKILAHLRMLLDLVEWHSKRKASGIDTRLRRARKSRIEADCVEAFTAQQDGEDDSSSASVPPPPVLKPGESFQRERGVSHATIRLPWDQSQSTFEAGVEETFDTLTTLFGEDFSATNAEDHAIFLQMKEAFRIADVHRRGVVDASELCVLLEKLMPYAGGHGDVQMDQYVDEFMQLVDKNHDGKVSFAEFMQALNEGFRLELEIYEATNNVPINDALLGSAKSPPRSQLQTSRSMRLVSRRESLDSTNSTDELVSNDNCAAPAAASRRAAGSSELNSSFIDVSKLGSFLFRGGSSADTYDSSHRSIIGGGIFTRRQSSAESSAPEALLNVESFSIKAAATSLKQSYGEFLLDSVDDRDQHVTMEDLIIMSCLISACEDLATTLAALSTLAAS